MRFILAGLFLLTIPTLTFAQASGEVQSIGFGNGYYKPNCWTPMLVRLTPDTTESANYEIQVWQHDLDGDRPIYTRSIVLNGSDQAPSQRFWTYFLPQPTDKGLPDGPGTQRDLQKDLQVFLCLPNHKQIAKLPITSTIDNVDPIREGNVLSGRPRASKLILAVSTNGGKQPTLGYYNKTVGAKEDLEVVNIHAADLPEDPIGYEGVDAIIWLEGDPAQLSAGNLDTFNALKDYVRFGGKLIVCQSTSNWQEDLNFGDMLPVDVQGLATKSNFEPLLSMAQSSRVQDPLYPNPADTWSHTAGPYQMARSTARPGAVVNNWIDWKQDGSNSDATPYLARKSYGLGEVTWVAQPLTTESAPTNLTAWPYIWDKVFGWTSDGYVPPDKTMSDDDKDKVAKQLGQYEPATPRDLGYALVTGLDLNSKANWLILLAIVFYVVYWLISGPGSYAYLATKKKQGWSWFFFGISALGAILVTVLVVKLVLRGPPEIRHVSFVRIAPGQPAIVHSRFGLYIPRDGDQKISLDQTSPTSVSYLSPFAEHPQQLGAEVTEFPSPTEYFVPVRDLKSDTQPQLTVAYRSSLKKFQARWVGEMDARIAGSVKLDPDDFALPLAGTLSNATGMDLSDVYLAFNAPNGTDKDRDWLIYIPSWGKGVTYDIKRDFAKPKLVGRDTGLATPGDKKILSDELAYKYAKNSPKGHGWINYWYSHFHESGDDPNSVDDAMNDAYPELSLFDRLPAMPSSINENDSTKINKDRVEIYNRGAGMLNASQCIADGQLVVMASAKGPLPIPVQVDDEKMTGDGVVYYQFILPMDRGKVDMPTTMPSK